MFLGQISAFLELLDSLLFPDWGGFILALTGEPLSGDLGGVVSIVSCKIRMNWMGLPLHGTLLPSWHSEAKSTLTTQFNCIQFGKVFSSGEQILLLWEKRGVEKVLV